MRRKVFASSLPSTNAREKSTGHLPKQPRYNAPRHATHRPRHFSLRCLDPFIRCCPAPFSMWVCTPFSAGKFTTAVLFCTADRTRHRQNFASGFLLGSTGFRGHRPYWAEGSLGAGNCGFIGLQFRHAVTVSHRSKPISTPVGISGSAQGVQFFAATSLATAASSLSRWTSSRSPRNIPQTCPALAPQRGQVKPIGLMAICSGSFAGMPPPKLFAETRGENLLL